jgi:hypothetical protein
MQAELKAAKPELNIELLGVNRIDQNSFNQLVTAVSNLPWLQDTATDAVWSLWQVSYRDVWILDSQGRFLSVFNLTTHDLSVRTNYTTLKQMFLDAARVVDSDGDRLPDDWELQYFANLASGPNDDPDGDGIDNFSEFAFGTNPTNASSFFSVQPSVTFKDSSAFLTMSFRQPAGSILDYVIQASPDLQAWSGDPAEVVVARPPRRLFDGTGRVEVFYSLANSTSVRPNGFLRVSAVSKIPPP